MAHFVDGVSRFLYDGQTRELLAITHFTVQNAKSEMWGAVYGRNRQANTLANSGWNDATGYIREKMAEDDRLQ
jgi:hypothetical protein